MKKHHTLFLVIITFLFFSCEPTDIKIDRLVGEWQLQNSSALIHIKNEVPIDKTIDLSSNKYILNIKSDGTFTIDMDDASRKKIESLSIGFNGTILSLTGTYQLTKDQIEFNYFGPNSTMQNQKFKIFFANRETIEMFIDREFYLEIIRNQLIPQAEYFKSRGVSIEEIMSEIESEIIAYNARVIYKKI